MRGNRQVVRPENRDHDGDAGRRTLHEISRGVSNANRWPSTSAFTCASNGRRARKGGRLLARKVPQPTRRHKICHGQGGWFSWNSGSVRPWCYGRFRRCVRMGPRWHQPCCSFSIRAVAIGREGAHQDHGNQHERTGPRLAMPVFVGGDGVGENLDRQRRDGLANVAGEVAVVEGREEERRGLPGDARQRQQDPGQDSRQGGGERPP